MKNDGAYSLLLKKIHKKSATVGIIGIGVIGLPLAKRTAEVGFKTIGFDIDKKKVTAASRLKHKNLSATRSFQKISDCDVVCICVPTPLTKTYKPDLSFVKTATKTIGNSLSGGQLVILESSVGVGTTRNVVYPIIAKKKNLAFFLGYSPERIDVGNKKYTLVNTPKIVSGIDKQSLALIKAFYQTFIKKVVTASSVEAAELTKLFENTFRLINISFVHEIDHYAKMHNVDTWEIIDLAQSKPFGFLAHYPGPGVGGHCIPVDPVYLLHDAKKTNVDLLLVKDALTVNKRRPREIVAFANQLVKKKQGKKQTALLVGLSYKPNVSDIRESAALTIWELLEKNGWDISYHDPHVDCCGKKSKKLSQKLLDNFDLIIITANHEDIDYNLFAKTKTLVIDTRNVLKNVKKLNIVHF